MKPRINWDDLRLLEAVAHHGSLLRAAHALDTSVATMSRRLSKLETAVGTLLIERAADGCRTTSAGQKFVEIARQMSGQLERETSNLPHQTALGGTIKISTGEGFQEAILSEICKFSQAHPLCQIEYSIENEYRKVARGDVDIAIRTANHGEPSLVYRKVMEIEFALFGSQALFENLPNATEPSKIPLIGLLEPLSQEEHVRAARAAGFINTTIRVSSFTAQLAAVRSGMGAAVLPKQMSDGLLALAPELSLPTLPVFLVTRLKARSQPHLEAFLDQLLKRFRQFQD